MLVGKGVLGTRWCMFFTNITTIFNFHSMWTSRFHMTIALLQEVFTWGYSSRIGRPSGDGIHGIVQGIPINQTVAKVTRRLSQIYNNHITTTTKHTNTRTLTETDIDSTSWSFAKCSRKFYTLKHILVPVIPNLLVPTVTRPAMGIPVTEKGNRTESCKGIQNMNQ